MAVTAKPIRKLKTWSTTDKRVCSRCYVEQLAREFLVKRAGQPPREYKTCVKCRTECRERQRERAAELAWLRAEALVPYNARRRR